MCFRLLIHFLVFLVLFSKESFSSENAFGILVQVKDKNTLESKELKKLIHKNGLIAGKYYPSLKVQSFNIKTKNTNISKSLCETIKKNLSDVLICELNFKLKPQSDSTCSPLTSPIEGELEGEIKADILNITSSLECDLFNKNKMQSQNYELTEGLSPFWAQEYIGSDLLKEEMLEKKINTSNTTALLGVWDTYKNDHGDYVANLIAGPNASSLIQTEFPQNYINLQKTSNYFEAYEQMLNQCKSKSNCPRYINNSLSWLNSSLISEVVKKIAEDQNGVFVTAAGNAPTPVEDMKRKSSRDGHSIIVSTHAPDGLSSRTTSFAPEVDISAPSDSYILSYNKEKKPITFGGTSGATPLVTSTLLAFELIAGVQLTTPQYKNLLKKTAITHRDDPERVVTGAGYLNSYKIGAVAFKLVELCKEFTNKNEKDQCMHKKLMSDDLYDFSSDMKEDDIIGNIESAFPDCGEGSTSGNQLITCEQKEKALKDLRKASFLDPKNLKYWEKLACVHRVEKFTENATYYSRLASGTRYNNIQKSKLSRADIVDLLSKPENLKNYREPILKEVKQDGLLLQFAHDEFKKDHELVLTAVKQNGLALQFAHEDLKKDREFMLEAIKQHPDTLQFAHEDLKKDRMFMLEAVKQHPDALRHAYENFKKDRAFILAAVKQNGLALEHAHEDLKKDREFILAAVKQNGLALEFVQDDFKRDREVVLAAIKQNRLAIIYAHETLQYDPKIKAAAGF